MKSLYLSPEAMKTNAAGIPFPLLVLLPTLVQVLTKALVHKTPEELAGALAGEVRKAVPEEMRPVLGQALAALAAHVAE